MASVMTKVDPTLTRLGRKPLLEKVVMTHDSQNGVGLVLNLMQDPSGLGSEQAPHVPAAHARGDLL